tara:strand:- start:745 stop:945 length:201 start_codon:yes stop_codon:yes gene_type:complete
MVDVEGGNNLLYLPLDKLMESKSKSPEGSNNLSSPDISRNNMNSLSDKIRNNRNSFNSRKRDLYSE